MTDNVSRRNFVALAGAGVALGACGNGQTKEEDKLKNKGFPEDYGDNPNTQKENDISFDYIGLVHIKKNKNKEWGLVVNHAAFQIPTPNEEKNRLEKALRIFAKKGAGRFKDLSSDTDDKPYSRPVVGMDSEVFDKYFGFKSPNELFIFIEGDDVEVQQGALLSFTPLASDLTDRHPNYSFYHANRVDPKMIADAKLNGRIIRVRNYMTLSGGVPIDPENPKHKQLYSMNIHFSVPGSGGSKVAMIIDPDTGNGMGNNP